MEVPKKIEFDVKWETAPEFEAIEKKLNAQQAAALKLKCEALEKQLDAKPNLKEIQQKLNAAEKKWFDVDMAQVEQKVMAVETLKATTTTAPSANLVCGSITAESLQKQLDAFQYYTVPYTAPYGAPKSALPHRCKYIYVGDKKMLLVDEPNGDFILIPVVAEMKVSGYDVSELKDNKGFWRHCYDHMMYEIAKRLM
jgi:hypothetical protein